MKKLWEILVPMTLDGARIKREHHQEWDDKVSEIVGGLTILKSTKGRWRNSKNELLRERMLQVRIVATEDEMSLIADMTGRHYKQDAVMYYLISEKAIIKLTVQ